MAKATRRGSFDFLWDLQIGNREQLQTKMTVRDVSMIFFHLYFFTFESNGDAGTQNLARQQVRESE